MPTLEYFKSCPDFPSDIQVADIPVISLKRLQNNVETESHDVFKACVEHGGFLLNLQGSESGVEFLKDAESMFELSKATFNLEQDILLKHIWHPPRNLRGYDLASLSLQVISIDEPNS
jgi:hypothetical protein